MPIVTLRGVHKSFGNHTVLRSVDLTVSGGSRIGVVGYNGAGKSTLARILASIEAPDAGVVQLRRGARVLYLEQVPKFEGDPTAEQAVLAGLGAWSAASVRHEALSAKLASHAEDTPSLLDELSRAADEVERLGGWDQRHRALALLSHLGVKTPDARVDTLSGGEQRRVALARLLVSAPDLAVLDEPTNHLDADTIEWLEKYLVNEYRGAIVLITHDRYLLDNVATRTLEVADGEVYDYEGGYERYLEQKAERQAHAARTEQNRQNFLRRELEWLQRQPKARTTKQAARVDRAEAALATNRPKAEKTANFELDRLASGKTVLEIRGLAGEIAGRQLFSGLDLFMREGERVGIVGANGTGKTTLLRILLGQLPPAAGSVVIGQNTKIVYLDQQRSGLSDDKSVLENVLGDQSTIELGGQLIEPRSYLERFAFDRDKQRQPVGSLSGGERARVALARMLRRSANLVIMDEPTNDLDVATLGALESMLVDYAVTALVVTHDRWFLDRVATAILSFDGEGRVVRYPGNYDTFRRLRAQAQAASTVSAEPLSAREPGVRQKSHKNGLSAQQKRELAGLPDSIEKLEGRILELSDKLSDPRTYATGKSEVPALQAELASQRAEVERLMARWEELEGLNS